MNDFESIYALFPKNIPESLHIGDSVEEIRLRAGRQIELYSAAGSVYLRETTSPQDLNELLNKACGYSLYAKEDELLEGFLTLRGGHRIGFCASAIHKDNKITGVEYFSSVCIRVARQIKGCAEKFLPLITNNDECILSCLFISPPGVGKTTLLRDIARLISKKEGRPSFKTAIVDTRGEIAACHNGMPQLDVGYRCDVFDNAPKGEAVMSLIRSMSPQVIITDELGNESDCRALNEALRCGVKIIASSHGDYSEEKINSPFSFYAGGVKFERYIFLQRDKNGISAKKILDADFGVM